MPQPASSYVQTTIAAQTPKERLMVGLQALLNEAAQALENPTELGSERFIGQLANLLTDVVDESVQAHIAELRRSRGGEGAAGPDARGSAGRLRLVAEPDSDDPVPAPRRSLADGGGVLRIQVLGRDRGLVQVAGGEIVLSRRHSEIVVLLAARPAGMTSEQLALALYGEQGRPQTARAEVSRLRRLLGPYIETDPYRLEAVVRSDIAEVEGLLRQGRAGEAAAAYRGPLLPGSDAPGVVDLRDELDGWTRRAALAADDPGTLWRWVNTPSGQDDITAWKRLLTLIPHHDSRRALAAARLARLRSQFATSAQPHPVPRGR